MGNVSNVQATQSYPDSLASIYKYVRGEGEGKIRTAIPTATATATKRHQHFSFNWPKYTNSISWIVRSYTCTVHNEIILSTKWFTRIFIMFIWGTFIAKNKLNNLIKSEFSPFYFARMPYNTRWYTHTHSHRHTTHAIVSYRHNHHHHHSHHLIHFSSKAFAFQRK